MTQPGKAQSTNSQLYWVADNVIATDFPDAATALRDPEGLLAIGGDLEPDRLLNAYRRGIFPWYSQGQPVLWWSPNPRCVLEPDAVKISRSLAKTLKKKKFTVTFNQAFADVVKACAAPREPTASTWITTDMAMAYIKLHHMGYGVSVECWHNDILAGGLYGVVIGKVFFGESMFSRITDASKVALAHLAYELNEMRFRIIDCQVHSSHLQNLGAKSMPRDLFTDILERHCSPDKKHDWPAISELSCLA